jgi:U4/U6.U5 tri-snRNP-associated protein 1
MPSSFTENFEVSDYATEDTTFKKKKKKSKRNIRQADVGQEDGAAGAEVAMVPLDRSMADNLVDDDDLQSALSRQRKQATMKRGKRMRVDDIVAQVAQARESNENAEGEEAGVKIEEGAGGDAGLTFDDTTEFVRNVTLESLVKREPARPAVASSSSTAAPATAGGIQLPDGITVKQEPGEEATQIRVKIETTDDDQPLGGLEVGVNGQGDVDMERAEEEGELSEEDEELAEMALRQGLSIEEMRLKMDAEMVKTEAPEDVSILSFWVKFVELLC